MKNRKNQAHRKDGSEDRLQAIALKQPAVLFFAPAHKNSIVSPQEKIKASV